MNLIYIQKSIRYGSFVDGILLVSVFFRIALLNRKSIDFILKIGYDEMKSVLK